MQHSNGASAASRSSFGHRRHTEATPASYSSFGPYTPQENIIRELRFCQDRVELGWAHDTKVRTLKKRAERRHQELDSGRFNDLLRAIRRHADEHDEARQCFQYLHRNRDRMRNPQFEAEGLCASSGVVEAGCKLAIGTRLKRAGMHWTISGANAIIALRCSRLSGRFQDYWERRNDRARAAGTLTFSSSARILRLGDTDD